MWFWKYFLKSNLTAKHIQVEIRLCEKGTGKAHPLLGAPIWDTILNGGVVYTQNPEISEKGQQRWSSPLCLCVKTARQPGLHHQIPGPLASQNGGQWSRVSREGQKLRGGLMILGFISNILVCCVKDSLEFLLRP